MRIGARRIALLETFCLLLLLLLLAGDVGYALRLRSPGQWCATRSWFCGGQRLPLLLRAKVSPFEATSKRSRPSSKADSPTPKTLSLTKRNVEKVLDELRPMLRADGGDVRVSQINGTTVFLRLEGACGTCASSAATMKLGLEKQLLERIPAITQVVQAEASPSEPLTIEAIESVLASMRPYLKIAGGTLKLVSLGPLEEVGLHMGGVAAGLPSLKTEVVQRLQKKFKRHVRVNWT